MSQNQTEMTRQELYDLVWARPIMDVAKDLGISDRGLGKVCERYNIPKPPRGYWQKLQVGKARKRPKLPPAPKDYGDTVIIGSAYNAGQQAEKDSIPDEPPDDKWERMIWFEHQPENRIVVPDRGHFHELVRDTRAYLEDEFSNIPWYERRERPTIRHLSVDVRSKAAITRVCRLWQEIITAASARGWEIEVKRNEYDAWQTHIMVGGYSRSLKVKTVSLPPKGTGYPNPRLCIDLGYTSWQQKWNDGTQQRVENVLNEVFIVLIKKSRSDHQREVNAQRKERKVARIRAERAAAVYAHQAERRRVEKLQEHADDWEAANRMRAYIEHVRRMPVMDAARIVGSDRDAWLSWADDQVARLDPTMDSPYSSLDDPPPGSWFNEDRGVTTWYVELDDDDL